MQRKNKSGSLINLILLDNSDSDKKIAILATKAELKEEQDKLVKLQVFDSSYYYVRSHFEDDDMQN